MTKQSEKVENCEKLKKDTADSFFHNLLTIL